jgi:hypothetical protein
MNRLLLSFGVVLVSALPCAAIPIPSFVDIPTFVERSRDIVIARCIRPDVGEGTYIDNLHPAEVEVLSVLKGDKTTGKLRIATVYNLEAGKTYFLANSGGSAYGTNFLAIAERTVVKLPEKFRLADLKGKKLAEQVQAVFTAAGLRDADLLSKTLVPRLWEMRLPPDEAGTQVLTLELLVKRDKERVARAAQKVQQSKSVAELGEAVREMEEAVKALKATLASWGGLVAPSASKKP